MLCLYILDHDGISCKELVEQRRKTLRSVRSIRTAPTIKSIICVVALSYARIQISRNYANMEKVGRSEIQKLSNHVHLFSKESNICFYERPLKLEKTKFDKQLASNSLLFIPDHCITALTELIQPTQAPLGPQRRMNILPIAPKRHEKMVQRKAHRW